MDKNKLIQYQKLLNDVATRDAYLQAKERKLQRQQRILRQGGMSGYPQMGADSGADTMGPETSGTDIQTALANGLPKALVPGNVGDINRVIWPFYFTTDMGPVPPNTNFRSGFNVTQEAAFIWMSFTKCVFIQDDESGDLSYIDPDVAGAAGCAFNLAMTIRDSSSERDFENTPFDMDTVGNPRWPTKYPRPSIFPPNANIEISFTNSDPNLTYVPFVTAFGYRIRIEDARTLLSFMSA